MSLRRRTSIFAAALAALSLVLAGTAGGAGDGKEPTKTTIRSEGGKVFGFVESDRTYCEYLRRVAVFKVVGKKGGEDDKKIASDSANKNADGDYRWSIGDPGASGKIYAKALEDCTCTVSFSKTIKV